MAGTRWDHLDDGDLETGEAPSDSDRALRPIVWILSLFIVIVLLGVPIMRAITYDHAQSPEKAAREARAHVAVQFAKAALERRSTRLAEEWAIEGLHDPIDAVVAELQLRDPADLQDATSSVYREPCASAAAFPDSECFLARLTRPDGVDADRLHFTVAIVGGRAQVVALD